LRLAKVVASARLPRAVRLSTASVAFRLHQLSLYAWRVADWLGDFVEAHAAALSQAVCAQV